MDPIYTIQVRRNCVAIMRSGPRGGSKFMMVYRDKWVAEEVCRILNSRAAQEGTK